MGQSGTNRGRRHGSKREGFACVSVSFIVMGGIITTGDSIAATATAFAAAEGAKHTAKSTTATCFAATEPDIPKLRQRAYCALQLVPTLTTRTRNSVIIEPRFRCPYFAQVKRRNVCPFVRLHIV